MRAIPKKQKISFILLVIAIAVFLTFGVYYTILLIAEEESQNQVTVTAPLIVRPPIEVDDWSTKLPNLGNNPILAMNTEPTTITSNFAKNTLVGAGGGRLYLVTESGSKDNITVSDLSTQLNFGTSAVNTIAGESNNIGNDVAVVDSHHFNLVGGDNGKLALVFLPRYNSSLPLQIKDQSAILNLPGYSIKSIKYLSVLQNVCNNSSWLIWAESAQESKLIYAKADETNCFTIFQPNMNMHFQVIDKSLYVSPGKITALETFSRSESGNADIAFAYIFKSDNNIEYFQFKPLEFPNYSWIRNFRPTIQTESKLSGQKIIQTHAYEDFNVHLRTDKGNLYLLLVTDISTGLYDAYEVALNGSPATYINHLIKGYTNILATQDGKIYLYLAGSFDSFNPAGLGKIMIDYSLDLINDKITSTKINYFGLRQDWDFYLGGFDNMVFVGTQNGKFLRIYSAPPQLTNASAKRAHPFLILTISGYNLATNDSPYFKTADNSYYKKTKDSETPDNSTLIGYLSNNDVPQATGSLYVYENFFQKAGKIALTTPPEIPEYNLMKGSGNEVYYILGSERRWIPDMTTFNAYGFKWSDIQRKSDAEISAIPLGKPLTNIIKRPNSNPVYFVSMTKAHWVTSTQVFNKLRLDWNKISLVTSEFLDRKVYYGADIRTLYKNPFVTEPGAIYLDMYVNNYPEFYGSFAKVPNVQTFLAYGFDWNEAKPLDGKGGGGIDIGRPLSVLIRNEHSTRVYYMEGGLRRWITSASAFERHGWKWADVYKADDGWIDAWPQGAPIY